MINVDVLKQENQQIIELTAILQRLIDDSDLRDNAVFCELMERFNNSVEAHLIHEDRTIYSDLLKNENPDVHKLADQFMTNTHELRRLMKDYTKRWCHSGNKDHSTFVDKTREIFSLVNMRINLEDSKLFPAIVNIS